MVKNDTQPNGQLTIQTLAMPADANPSGDIFGGWVLSQMDLAAAICAGRRANGRVVTVAINAMSFLLPVYIGDLLCVYAKIKHIGNTSIAVALEAWAVRGRIGEQVKVTEGIFTFVAIDDDGKPRKLPVDRKHNS